MVCTAGSSSGAAPSRGPLPGLKVAAVWLPVLRSSYSMLRAGACALSALLAVTEWRIRGRLAAARLGAQLAVGGKQLGPHYAGALHVGLQEGKAAGPPGRHVVGRQVHDPHALLHGKGI